MGEPKKTRVISSPTIPDEKEKMLAIGP